MSLLLALVFGTDSTVFSPEVECQARALNRWHQHHYHLRHNTLSQLLILDERKFELGGAVGGSAGTGCEGAGVMNSGGSLPWKTRVSLKLSTFRQEKGRPRLFGKEKVHELAGGWSSNRETK